MTDERWADTHKMCNGFASYYGPCGDPYCSDCYPGGRVCTQCGLLDGECECDNCDHCGEPFDLKKWCVCPDCHCDDCGELKSRDCKCGTCPCPDCDAEFEAKRERPEDG